MALKKIQVPRCGIDGCMTEYESEDLLIYVFISVLQLDMKELYRPEYFRT